MHEYRNHSRIKPKRKPVYSDIYIDSYYRIIKKLAYQKKKKQIHEAQKAISLYIALEYGENII